MRKDDKASVSLKKVIAVSIILLFLMGIAVLGVNTKLNNVKIILSNGYEMKVLTTKTNISEILEENSVILMPTERVVPGLQEQLGDNNTIRIIENIEDVQVVSETIETSEKIDVENILMENYKAIIEKKVVEQVSIPYETNVKDVSTGTGAKQEHIIRKGIDGTKEITYKVKYQNDIEIERNLVSETVVKEPVNKEVEIRDKKITARTTVSRVATTNPAETASTALAEKVRGITPTVVNMNTSAYCACIACCGKTNGITASGAKASEWYTVAAGRQYAIGTVIYIPALSDKPNGGWFVVQDRGGAITNNKLDIYLGSHGSALQYGRKTLECYIYEF